MFADLKERLRKALFFTILWISVSCWKIQNWVKDKKAAVVVGWEEGTFSEAEAVLSDHWKMEKKKIIKLSLGTSKFQQETAPSQTTSKGGAGGAPSPKRQTWGGVQGTLPLWRNEFPAKDCSLPHERLSSHLAVVCGHEGKKGVHLWAWLATLRHGFPSWSKRRHGQTPVRAARAPHLSCHCVTKFEFVYFPLIRFLHKSFTGGSYEKLWQRKLLSLMALKVVNFNGLELEAFSTRWFPGSRGMEQKTF